MSFSCQNSKTLRGSRKERSGAGAPKLQKPKWRAIAATPHRKLGVSVAQMWQFRSVAFGQQPGRAEFRAILFHLPAKRIYRRLHLSRAQ
jgi:hypothetical protein